MMNPEIKAEWIAALRSGKYPQGAARLKDRDGRYCCLGVLQTVCPVGRAGEDELLDTAAAEEIGLSYQYQVKLAEMNDHGEHFAGIADYIERTL